MTTRKWCHVRLQVYNHATPLAPSSTAIQAFHKYDSAPYLDFHNPIVKSCNLRNWKFWTCDLDPPDSTCCSQFNGKNLNQSENNNSRHMLLKHMYGNSHLSSNRFENSIFFQNFQLVPDVQFQLSSIGIGNEGSRHVDGDAIRHRFWRDRWKLRPHMLLSSWWPLQIIWYRLFVWWRTFLFFCVCA